ncbi:MAG: hypothetical protein HZB86_07650 [Deltaproteobacteria bacterium]|nr:hypothetical protein [Deltaproteobacteria bacterium]
MLKSIRNHYFRDVINRLNDLETAVRVLTETPAYEPGDGVGLNGSMNRKRIFGELLRKYDFSFVIETGTYLGDTAGYFAEASNLPVCSSEINPMLHSLARMRLKGRTGIRLVRSDSRKFLEDMGADRDVAEKECFFYLDAHWGKDCPLAEEISIIASRWRNFVVMVDDFQVPGDPGYAYDRCGMFRWMNLSLIRKSVREHDLGAYFPSTPAREESALGKPKGFVVLARNGEYGDRLKTVSLLREHRSAKG